MGGRGASLGAGRGAAAMAKGTCGPVRHPMPSQPSLGRHACAVQTGVQLRNRGQSLAVQAADRTSPCLPAGLMQAGGEGAMVLTLRWRSERVSKIVLRDRGSKVLPKEAGWRVWHTRGPRVGAGTCALSSNRQCHHARAISLAHAKLMACGPGNSQAIRCRRQHLFAAETACTSNGHCQRMSHCPACT